MCLHPQDHSRLPFARLERCPLHVGEGSTTDLCLNLVDDTHFSYIHNLSLYAQTFGYTRCPKLLNSSKDLLNHLRTCTSSTKHTTKGESIFPKQTACRNWKNGGSTYLIQSNFLLIRTYMILKVSWSPYNKRTKRTTIFLLLLYHPR